MADNHSVGIIYSGTRKSNSILRHKLVLKMPNKIEPVSSHKGNNKFHSLIGIPRCFGVCQLQTLTVTEIVIAKKLMIYLK